LCETPEILATNLLALLREPYAIENKIIYLTASIGVAVYFEDIEGAESIIRHGDIALRQAKSLGKNRFTIYEKVMSEQISERLLMANELRTAIERGEMYLCFQPQIDLESNEIFGFESLLRWNSAVYGQVSPSRFIPLAEETGLIIGIGKWVFEQSCQFLKVISEIDSEIIVSVNVAAQQLERASFIDEVREAMRKSGIRPEQICLEITESSVIKSLETAIYHLNQLKGECVKIALDDFGTGFSSLNYLNQLPIDFLKIDRSFTSRITGSSKEYTLIKSIISLSRALNLKLILEGIEEKEQLVLIEEMGKAIIQGYYYAKPMVELDAIAFIHQYKQECIGIS
jgi:EAL domain-containing protein (putative c-di-GMP-specific phosphodiesterase class I)